jgi:hypothetical protein
MSARWCSIALAFICGCSGGGTASPDLAEAPPDLAEPRYPSPHTAQPQAQTTGGPVVASPKFVAVSFAGDSSQSDIDGFVAGVVASSYWTSAVAEYGVGAASAPPVVHSTDKPAAMVDDSDVIAWLKAHIGNTLPAADSSTIYTLFYPAGVTVTFGGGVSCSAFNGYHNDYQDTTGKYVTYIVLPRCPPPVSSITTFDFLTATASHEFIEAATDPLPQDMPAWNAVDQIGFGLVGGGAEIGDLCAAFPSSFYRPAGLPYLVQRVWSNAAAAANHDPCQPDGASPYFNAAPVGNDMLTVSAGGFGTVQASGVRIPVGQSATVELQLFSDAPTSGPWKLSVLDVTSAFFGGAPELKLALDKDSGQDGDVVHLTITALKADPLGAAPYWVQSDLGSRSTVWIGLVGN